MTCFKTMMAAALAACIASAEACTSWVINPQVTRSGMMVLQKVLDYYPCQMDADMRVAPNGWRWMRIGTKQSWPSFAMNEKGVAMTTNDGDKVAAKHPRDGQRYGTGSSEMIRQVVTNCSTAAEGAKMIRNIARNRLTAGSSGIYFVADPQQAFMINLGHGYAEVMEIRGGMVIVTNTWRLPGGEEVSLKEFGPGRGDRAREANTRASLQKLRIDGKYTIRGCIDTSRRKCGSKLNELYPFRKYAKVRSLASVCFELDREFPAYLSAAYIALGPQQHTLFIPVPMALRQMPEKMRSGAWNKLAIEHQEAAGSDHADLPEMSKLEDKFLAEFDAARDRARRLLREGRRDEAVKILNECFDRQYAEADKLMTGLQAAAAAARKEPSKKAAQ